MIFCERGDRNKKKTGGGREAAIAKVIAHAGSADFNVFLRKTLLARTSVQSVRAECTFIAVL